jgi:hypothetical protein
MTLLASKGAIDLTIFASVTNPVHANPEHCFPASQYPLEEQKMSVSPAEYRGTTDSGRELLTTDRFDPPEP